MSCVSRVVGLALSLLVACATRPARVGVGPLGEGLGPYLASHPLAVGQGIRADEVLRSPSASWSLVQVRTAESPHRHVAHDLTVTVLRGEGTLVLDGRRIAMRAGDVVAVPRGVDHHFANTGGTPALALVVFTPSLDAPDTLPVVDSGGDRR